jgi:DNA-binding transcriptional LysR family regulator
MNSRKLTLVEPGGRPAAGGFMNWDDVRIFLAVARAGQILGAAKRLGLNHATVSRRLAALEEALRTKLFRRHTTGSELTAAGERFLSVAERMEADMISARADLAGDEKEFRGSDAGDVRILAEWFAERIHVQELDVWHRVLLQTSMTSSGN